MGNIEPIEILQRLMVLTLAAMVTSWCWLILRVARGEPILPERPVIGQRSVPWHAGTILLVFVLYVFVGLFLSVSYGFIAPLLPGSSDHIPWSHMMFLNGLVMAVLLVLVPWAVRRTSGAHLSDVGLSLEGWWPQLVTGVVATMIAAPPVYAVQIAATRIWDSEEHPLKKMMEQEFSVGVGWLAVVTAVVLAPMFEELVFRGLLQSWLVALLDKSSAPKAVYVDIDGDQPAAAAKSTHMNGSSAEFSATPHLPDRRWLAILLSSLLFAYVHAPQWPAPIALFVLALVIGTVYYRTNSLITAICMHATFNGISTLMLFFAAVGGGKSEPAKVTSLNDTRRVTGEACISAESRPRPVREVTPAACIL